ncbi:MAG: hypothetical protein JNM24_00510 [Bdellovibrionaceae bacterium]|nr:hypothetical protein [Pseudobdellovibrionaceae bacterium]
MKALNYATYTLLILFAVCPKLAFGQQTCRNQYEMNNKDKHISIGIENSTFSKVSDDLTYLVGNTEIAEALSNLTSKPGLRVQVAYITGEIGRGQVHFSRVLTANNMGIIDSNNFDVANSEALKKANASGKPILNTSILVSRELKPLINEEDQNNADQIYESFLNQLMLEKRLSRQQLMVYKDQLAGKVWYFVTQTNSKPNGSIVIYDPSKK